MRFGATNPCVPCHFYNICAHDDDNKDGKFLTNLRDRQNLDVASDRPKDHLSVRGCGRLGRGFRVWRLIDHRIHVLTFECICHGG